MQRLFHIAFLAIIGIALAVQTVRFGISHSGAGASALPLLEQAGVFVLFAGVIAFFKFVLSVLRSWQQRGARIAALGYLVVLVWPLLLAGVDRWMAIGRQGPVLKASLGDPAGPPSPEPRQNEQYLAGQAWARENRPTVRAECKGSQEFVRGCFIYILKAREQEEAAGQRWASENRPQRASDCLGKTPHEQLGCRRWYHQQPHAVREWPYGAATTAECTHEVDSNGELATQLYLLSGNDDGAAVFRRKHWLPDRRQCELIDRRVQDPFMATAYARLSAILEKMKAGAAVTAQDNATFSSDFSQMAKIPDQPYKAAYEKLASEFLDRQAGTYKEHTPQYPRISCEEYAAEIAKMRKLEAARVAEMQGLREPGGVVRNGARWAELNQLRLDMMWDWKYFNDGARAAGCAVAGS